jgi:tripartite-type tricarboxylate transporter receptor subunit TctC
LKKNRFMTLCVCAAFASTAVAGFAADSTWPDKPIRLIVPNATGSSVDVLARVLADKFKVVLGQPMLVDNRPGAAGVPGTETLVRANKDGHTLGFVANNHVINPAVYKKLPYDAVRDITPITIVGTTPLVLVAGPSFPPKTIADVVAHAKAQPGTLTYGSAGSGSLIHLAGELLRSNTHIEIQHIPYKGGNQLMAAVLGNEVSIAFLAIATVLPQIQAGKLKAIGVSVPKRIPTLPDVPTLAESGAPGFAIDAWIALIGPAGLPKNIVDRLSKTTRDLLSDKAVLEAMRRSGIEPIGSTVAEARTLFETDLVKYMKLAGEAGLRLD